MQTIEDLSEVTWWKPWTWFGFSRDELHPGEQSILDEVQRLGRVKVTCVIRQLQVYALYFLKVKQRAELQGDAASAAGCKAMRTEINSVVDYLYELIDLYFGGEGGREAAVGQQECHDSGIEAFPLVPVAIVTAILAAGGVLAYSARALSELVRYATAAGYCAVTDSTEKCKAALAAAQPPKEEGDGLLPKILGKDATGKLVTFTVLAGGVLLLVKTSPLWLPKVKSLIGRKSELAGVSKRVVCEHCNRPAVWYVKLKRGGKAFLCDMHYKEARSAGKAVGMQLGACDEPDMIWWQVVGACGERCGSIKNAMDRLECKFDCYESKGYHKQSGLSDLEFNPYHDVEGRFSSKEAIRSAEHGSHSLAVQDPAKKKARVRSGGRMWWVMTTIPCGRSAREIGQSIRCWDGRVV